MSFVSQKNKKLKQQCVLPWIDTYNDLRLFYVNLFVLYFYMCYQFEELCMSKEY